MALNVPQSVGFETTGEAYEITGFGVSKLSLEGDAKRGLSRTWDWLRRRFRALSQNWPNVLEPKQPALENAAYGSDRSLNTSWEPSRHAIPL